MIGALSVLYCALSLDAMRYKGLLLDEGPTVKVLNLSSVTFTPSNCSLVYSAIQNAIEQASLVQIPK
jgi:hypothetical protein